MLNRERLEKFYSAEQVGSAHNTPKMNPLQMTLSPQINFQLDKHTQSENRRPIVIGVNTVFLIIDLWWSFSWESLIFRGSPRKFN